MTCLSASFSASIGVSCLSAFVLSAESPDLLFFFDLSALFDLRFVSFDVRTTSSFAFFEAGTYIHGKHAVNSRLSKLCV